VANFVVYILTLVLSFTFWISCEGWAAGIDPAAPQENAGEARPAPAHPIRLGVAWEGKAEIQERLAQGLQEALSVEAPGIEIEWQKELPDSESLDAVVKRFQREKDGMVLLRSKGAEYLVQHPPSIPSFVGGCNDPVHLGVVQNPDAPEGNVTGVTYALSYDVQFQAFLALLPEMRSVLLLYEEGHPGSSVDRAGTRATATKLGILYHEKGCQTVSEVIVAIQQARGQVSAILLGNQALVLDNAAPFVAAAGEIPIFAYSSKSLNEGTLCGLAADDVKLGRMLAGSIIDVLLKGKPICQVPFKRDREPRFYVNLTTAERLGITIPLSVLSVAEIVR